MADPRRLELEELINRPGTYFNPQLEVLVVVDDSPELDAEIFNEVPVDENRRDELLETFQTRHQRGGREEDDELAEELEGDELEADLE
jgi:hypothetical protein